MFSTDPNPFPHKEWNSLRPEVVEEALRTLAEEDAIQEKKWQMKWQLSKQQVTTIM